MTRRTLDQSGYSGLRSRGICATVVSAALCLAVPRFATAGEVKETYDTGSPKLVYHTDAQDRKFGDYQEFHPNGKTKVRGTYTAGKKSGQWNTYDESGKLIESSSYRNDLLDGPYVWNFPSGKPGVRGVYSRGQLSGPLTVMDEKGHAARRISYPRSRESVEKAFLTLYPAERPPVKFTTEASVHPPYKAGVLAPETLDAAVKVTKLYRYLSGVPWQDLKADPVLCDKSAHGAVILAHLGTLTHTPEKPGDMDGAFYKVAYQGCAEDNLYMGSNDPISAVRGFMDDSDASNVDRIGHRQWVLSPGLQRVGFGAAERFVSMHVFDGNRQVKLDYGFIAFPGEGWYPRALLGARWAWSLHVNAAKAKVGSAESVKIKVYKLDEHYQPVGDPIAAPVVSTPGSMSPAMGWQVIVFRPELGEGELEPARYWVEVSDVRSIAGGDAPLGYLVDLIDVQPPETAAK